VDKKGSLGGAHVEETTVQSRGLERECPSCGEKTTRLYRTPRGLKCGDCVKKMDSAGLGFR